MKLSCLSSKKWLLIALLFVLIIVVWQLSLEPSNNRDWALDQKILPEAIFEGDSVTINNIRNFTYQTEKIYTPNYYNKTFNLNEIATLDYIVEPLGGIGAAHTFLSFGFRDGSYVAVSVEIRKEVGEKFSPLKGLFRQYELMYVIADERDVIKLRTNYRQDPVYLYPVKIDADSIRRLFIDMLDRANALESTPEFYNTLTNTCTTNIATHVNSIAPNKIPFDIRLLLPKYSDTLAYELGLIDNSLPLKELREQHLINDKAETCADSPNFSRLIRR